jgi:hypothetical protein
VRAPRAGIVETNVFGSHAGFDAGAARALQHACGCNRLDDRESKRAMRMSAHKVDSRRDTMFRRTGFTALFVAAAIVAAAAPLRAQSHVSTKFSGAKVNDGTVTHSVKDGKQILTLSADFKVPDTPDPHWQVVDSRGNIHLLQRLGVKNLGGIAKDKVNMSITLPGYVADVAKVQIYCSWAEAVLGEASFATPVATGVR